MTAPLRQRGLALARALFVLVICRAPCFVVAYFERRGGKRTTVSHWPQFPCLGFVVFVCFVVGARYCCGLLKRGWRRVVVGGAGGVSLSARYRASVLGLVSVAAGTGVGPASKKYVRAHLSCNDTVAPW